MRIVSIQYQLRQDVATPSPTNASAGAPNPNPAGDSPSNTPTVQMTTSSISNSTTPAGPPEPSQFEVIMALIWKYIVIGAKALWAWINTFPIPPEETLGFVGFFLFLMIIGCCCLCCRTCCKQKQKKKRVKAKIDLRKNHLFGPHYAERVQPGFDEFDYNVESTLFDALKEVKLGQIKFSLEFDGEENIVHVTIHEAKDIPAADISGTSDAYIKVLLKPAGKKEKKTRVIKSTLNPVYEESFEFKKVTYNDFTKCVLWLKLFDEDKGIGSDDLLGEAKVPIADLDLTKGKVPMWRVLVPEFKSEAGRFGKNLGLGHICIGLGYAPNSSVLAIFVMTCQDLQSTDEGGYSDPYVTLFLVMDGKKLKKRKTTVKLRTLNPTFNENFAFEIDFEKIEDVSLIFIVADYDKGEPGTPIGQVVLGQLGQGLGKKHWEMMRKSPGKPVANWHMLRPVIKPE